MAALGAIVCLAACNQSGGAATPGATATPETEDQKTYYALGMMMGRNLKQFNLSPADLEFVKSGLSDQAMGKTPVVDLATYGPKVQKLAQSKQGAADAAGATARKEKDKPFEEAAAKEEGATKLPSGLIIKTVTPGKGESPKDSDSVKVNYEGKLSDGTVFDSSYKRNQPAQFPLKGVIPCWTEGVAHMKVGETAMLTCPSAIAYGDRGRPPTIPGGATLQFKVELLEINPTPVAGAAGMPPGHPGMPPGHPGGPGGMPIHAMGGPMAGPHPPGMMPHPMPPAQPPAPAAAPQ
jgi:FKBP-type peptidyl-prolyl cis-trans isomerase FkpA